MTKPHANRAPLLVAAFLGITIVFACAEIMGFTAAIPGPRWLFESAVAHGLIEPVLFGWNMVVVAGIAIALPWLVAMSLLALAFPAQRTPVTLAFAAGAALGWYVLLPLAYGQPAVWSYSRHWWNYGHEAAAVAIVAAVLAWIHRPRGTLSGHDAVAQ